MLNNFREDVKKSASLNQWAENIVNNQNRTETHQVSHPHVYWICFFQLLFKKNKKLTGYQA